MGGELDCFNTSCRVVEVLLDKEVRPCFNCQGYAHMQSICRATKATCDKCARTHRTRDCKSLTWKCANGQGGHQAEFSIKTDSARCRCKPLQDIVQS
jgi:hypothetical protein